MKLPTASLGRHRTSRLGKSSLWVFLVLRGRRGKKTNYSKFMVIKAASLRAERCVCAMRLISTKVLSDSRSLVQAAQQRLTSEAGCTSVRAA